GFWVPADHVLVHKPATEFEGVKMWSPDEKRHLPLGWITNPQKWKYALGEAKAKRNEKVDRFQIVQLTGTKTVLENRSYWETDEGWWMRDMDGTTARPLTPPKDLAPGEKWIDVDLSRQTLVAYEGEKPVYATIVSTGRHDDNDPTKDHR